MNYYLFLIRKNLSFILVGISLVIASVSMLAVVRIQNTYKEPLLIAIDSNGTRIITRRDDPIFDTEAIAFVRTFLEGLYNFTPESFVQKVGTASEYMSASLWSQKEAQILDLKELVAKQEISTQATVTKISKISDFQFAAIVILNEFSRLQRIERTVKVEMRLEKTARSNKNPWGMEMAQYEEQAISRD